MAASSHDGVTSEPLQLSEQLPSCVGALMFTPCRLSYRHGVGKWQQVITDPDEDIGPQLKARSNVDLKVRAERDVQPDACNAMRSIH